MSLQAKLKRRRTTTEILEASLAARPVSTKEKNVVDDVEPAVRSTFSEEVLTTTKKLLEVMAPGCCT